VYQYGFTVALAKNGAAQRRADENAEDGCGNIDTSKFS
jgi:hypothetical protein